MGKDFEVKTQKRQKKEIRKRREDSGRERKEGVQGEREESSRERDGLGREIDCREIKRCGRERG